MMTVEPIQPYIEPVRKSVEVTRTPAEAFEIFTRRLTSWWPRATHSISQKRTQEILIEPRRGGRVYETRDDGAEFPWGEVLVWDEPNRFVMSWHPGQDPTTAQEVEIRFEPVEGGTRVHLEHRNWQRRGEDARAARDDYDGGWESVFGTRYAEACA